MGDLLRLIVAFLQDLGRSRASLEAEISLLRQQLAVLKRRSARPQFTRLDRLIFALLYGLSPQVISALHVVRPETRDSVAPDGLPGAVALEIAAAGRTAQNLQGDP